jgi:hypothetical protein
MKRYTVEVVRQYSFRVDIDAESEPVALAEANSMDMPGGDGDDHLYDSKVISVSDIEDEESE